MEAEDSEAAGQADRVRTVGAQQDAGAAVSQAVETPGADEADATGARRPDAPPATDARLDSASEPGSDAGQALETAPDVTGDEAAAPGAEENSETESEADPETELSAGKGRPVSSGIGCAALLLPLIAVAGAILCFAAGILSTVTGCTPNGSALCSANGAWFEFALPLFISPIIAAATAIGAVTVRRHRSSWLAVGYGIVFISIIVGLASASTGSN